MKQLSTDSRTNPSPELKQAQHLFSSQIDVRILAEVENNKQMNQLLEKEKSDDNKS